MILPEADNSEQQICKGGKEYAMSTFQESGNRGGLAVPCESGFGKLNMFLLFEKYFEQILTKTRL